MGKDGLTFRKALKNYIICFFVCLLLLHGNRTNMILSNFEKLFQQQQLA